MSKPPAKWTTDPKQIVARTETDGSFFFSAPLFDAGVKQLTLELRVDVNRAVHLRVKAAPTATLTDLRAWSDI